MNNLVQSPLGLNKDLPTGDLPHGIKGVIEITSFSWLLILLILLMIAAFLLVFWRWKSGRKSSNSSPGNSLEGFLSVLRELEESDLVAELEHLNAWHKLTASLKLFLQEVLEVPATDSTSDELAELLGAQAWLSEQQKEKLRDLFSRADLVKFAGLEVDKTELSIWIAVCESIANELYGKIVNSTASSGVKSR